VQVLAENKVVNNSSYNLGLIMLSSLMTMGLDKYSWSHVDLRTDPHTGLVTRQPFSQGLGRLGMHDF